MSKIEQKLRELGEELPPPKEHVANYLGCKQSGDILYVSARVSRMRGEVGTDLDVVQAQLAAKDALLDILAIIKNEIGALDRIVSVEKMVGFVRSAPNFIEQPKVIDGASDLLIALWGENGRHARTATGVAQLPFGAAVQLEMIMRIEDGDKKMEQEKYIVAARVETKYKDCIVAPEDAMIMATHTVVFGPDTEANCRKWMSKNCRG